MTNPTNTAAQALPATQYDIEDLPSLGMMHFYAVGTENHYFTTADGRHGFIKFG